MKPTHCRRTGSHHLRLVDRITGALQKLISGEAGWSGGAGGTPIDSPRSSVSVPRSPFRSPASSRQGSVRSVLAMGTSQSRCEAYMDASIHKQMHARMNSLFWVRL